jgi:phosphoribosylformylglycinamidine cyclo-ligase
MQLAGAAWDDKAPFGAGQSFADVLMTPTRIYVKPVLSLHRAGLLQAAAHITGGGLPGNLPRALPPGMMARLDAARWPLPPVFAWLARAGGVAADEMLRVFNCGIGMALVVSDAAAATALLAEHNEAAFAIGRVEADAGPATAQVRTPADWLA